MPSSVGLEKLGISSGVLTDKSLLKSIAVFKAVSDALRL